MRLSEAPTAPWHVISIYVIQVAAAGVRWTLRDSLLLHDFVKLILILVIDKFGEVYKKLVDVVARFRGCFFKVKQFLILFKSESLLESDLSLIL